MKRAFKYSSVIQAQESFMETTNLLSFFLSFESYTCYCYLPDMNGLIPRLKQVCRLDAVGNLGSLQSCRKPFC